MSMKKVNNQPLEYVPKSPVYPPPDDCSDKAESSSIPDLETPREEMSPMQDKIQQTDGETQMTVPADANADMDHFKDENRKDTLKRQLSTELDAAPMEPRSKPASLARIGKGCQVCQTCLRRFLARK